jgi:LmbE family N-acetylglucosaminyl deacetylase
MTASKITQLKTSLHVKIALGIGAHPDDLDYMAAGSLARLAAEGCDVYYVIITDGSKGSSDKTMSSKELVKLRQDEQRAACKILGVKDVFFLGYEDGMLEVTMQLKCDIVRQIRRLKPDVVFAMDPSMLYDTERGFINHPDHRAGGQAVMDAVFPLARDHLSFPELYNDEKLEPHKVKTLLLTNFTTQNFFIDIQDTLQLKLDALAAHASQVPDLAAAHTMIRQMAEATGKQTNLQFAEGFVRIDIK